MAVRSLLHYALEVPDQTVGEKVYRAFGLVDFFYSMRDPWGSFDDVPEACAWQPRDFLEGAALYRWGPPVPDDFGLNREVEA
jgi:hypothetical protein